jgi:hypothetical protein
MVSGKRRKLDHTMPPMKPAEVDVIAEFGDLGFSFAIVTEVDLTPDLESQFPVLTSSAANRLMVRS